MIQRKIHTKLAHIISLLLLNKINFILSIKFNQSVEDKCKTGLTSPNLASIIYIFFILFHEVDLTFLVMVSTFTVLIFCFERDLQMTQLFCKPKFKFHFRDPDGYFKLNI